MSIENIVFIYIYICISIVVFDLLFVHQHKASEKKLPKRVANLQIAIKSSCVEIKANGDIGRNNENKLVRYLSNVSYLNALRLIIKGGDSEFVEWVRGSTEVFLRLTKIYSHKPQDERAFFAYIFSVLPLNYIEQPLVGKAYINIMGIATRFVIGLDDKSIYVRENTMKALTNIGDDRYILMGVDKLSETQQYQSEKLLTDNLLSFKGNHEKICSYIWENFSGFNEVVQTAFINYMRLLKTSDELQREYADRFLVLLTSEDTNTEVKFAVIRYFRRYHNDEVYPVLRKYILEENDLNWEYSAIAVSAISSYPCNETVELLKKALTSPSWYVRYNAAESLIVLDIDCEPLLQELGDNYADEMVSFRLQINNLKSAPAE